MKKRIIRHKSYTKNKRKLIFSIIGILTGISFSFWDALVSYADTAPIEESLKMMLINVVSTPVFILRTVLYGGAGFWAGIIISYLFANKQKTT